jgi:asparagine synthase (glutamine-hydrolysing)
LKIRGITEKYLLREAAKPVITDTVYRRQKHPFLAPPVSMLPAERFHQMMQDTLRGSVLKSLPFYNQKKIVALLDRLPTMAEIDLLGWDPILMSVLSACVIQQRLGLGGSPEQDAFTSQAPELEKSSIELGGNGDPPEPLLNSASSAE